MPDAELRRAADAGTLRNPAVLAAQVRRMLRDPKARALAENFGGQWLQFRALESVTRDRERFPDFEDYLRLSMRRETELFFEHIVREDRSILDFIDGRYSFLNERLARHYGIPNVSGPEFRRVDLTGTPRGGVLTQGSVLTVSSYATRTSPVLRGKWVLDNLLDAPPPEPPPDVPNLDEADDRHGGVDAGAARGAPQEPDLRVVPPADGSARASASRTSTRSAPGGQWTASSRSTRRARCPTAATFNGPEELRAILDGRSRRVRAGLTVEAADLRARPRPRALRHEDGEDDRGRLPRAATTGSRPGAGDREQPAVPVAARPIDGARRTVTAQRTRHSTSR